MPELAHFPADADPDRVHDQLMADGAVILDGVLAPDQADAVRAELDPWVQATAPGRDRFTGFRTTRTGALVARSPLCRDLIRSARVLAQCDRLLLPACERYQLHLGQVIRIMPESRPRACTRTDGRGEPTSRALSPSSTPSGR